MRRDRSDSVFGKADDMAARGEDDLRGLSFEELLERSTTTSPPAEIVRQQKSRGGNASGRHSAPLYPLAQPGSHSYGCLDNGSAQPHIAHPASLTTAWSPRHTFEPSILSPASKTSASPSGFALTIDQPRVDCEDTLKSPQPFDFTSSNHFDMVREQQPARHPLAPSMANSLPTSNPLIQGKKDVSESTSQPLYPNLQSAIPSHPEFGKPTTLGVSPQPYSRTQPLAKPGSNSQASGGQQDKFSNLFIPSKKHPLQKPDLHKPHVITNPLQAFRDIKHTSSQSNNQGTSRTNLQDDDFYEIPKPPNFPTWQPKPVAPPSFSSHQPTNPYFRPQNVVDLTQDRSGFSSNDRFFREDQYAATNPYTYMDSTKANESIKGLLEGAFEDEEDKPRTRSRKKHLEKDLDDLAAKMQDMAVKGESKNDTVADAEDEEEEEEDDGTVPGLKVKLLPHQIEGVNWMCSRETGTKKMKGRSPKGGILADDMGLGKTIQSIALILTNTKPSPQELQKSKRQLPEGIAKGTIVVAPLALIRQWEGEIKDRVEESHALKVCVHHGPQRTKSYKELAKYDIVITTYQTLSSEHAASEGSLKVGCFGVHWYRIILDEAHSIKNRNAKATKAACALNAEYRWCLTGTPMQNGLDELQSLIHFLRIEPYNDLNEWRENVTKPITNGRGGLALRKLQAFLKTFMKRRTKDILKAQGPQTNSKGGVKAGKGPGFKIVARTVEKVEAEFSEQEREFYKRLESRTDRSLEMMMAGNKLSYASALVLLMRLRQACNHPRLTGSDLSNENDASSGSQTPSRRKASTEDDIDSIANMLGGLSVETKRCDVCQIELGTREASNGAFRCAECQEDLDKQDDQMKQLKEARREKRRKQELEALKVQRQQARRVIEDSDEENEAAQDKNDNDSSFGEDDNEYSSEESEPQEAGLLQSTKIRHLLTILKSDSHQHKYIVFSFFTSMLDLIEPFLKTNRIRFVRYDGKMRNDAREASLSSLRTDPSTRVLLCSLRAGSLGLNLTAASRVVILEPFWNPFVEEQAIDRVHRLNQTQDVKVYKITVKDTVEERILELQEKKRELAKATIEGKKGAMQLTKQDMMKLFDHDAERHHPIEVGTVDIAPGKSRGLLDGGSRVGSGPSAPASSTLSSISVSGAPSGGNGQASQRLSGGGARERVRVPENVKSQRKEHEIYGRRW